jgi:hypothetical protein
MDLDRDDAAGARRLLENDGGVGLRSTRRGALVLQTENARRMMRELRELRPRPTERGKNPGTVPAS